MHALLCGTAPEDDNRLLVARLSSLMYVYHMHVRVSIGAYYRLLDAWRPVGTAVLVLVLHIGWRKSKSIDL